MYSYYLTIVLAPLFAPIVIRCAPVLPILWPNRPATIAAKAGSFIVRLTRRLDAGWGTCLAHTPHAPIQGFDDSKCAFLTPTHLDALRPRPEHS